MNLLGLYLCANHAERYGKIKFYDSYRALRCATLSDEHRVAEREEFIFFLYGFFICFHDKIFSGERGNKHYKRAFGKVKVRYEHVHSLKTVSGVYENSRIGALRNDFSVFVRGAFERAARRRTYGDYPAAVFFCFIDFLCGFSIFSSFTGRKVPSPTWSITGAISTPMVFIFSRSSSVK